MKITRPYIHINTYTHCTHTTILYSINANQNSKSPLIHFSPLCPLVNHQNARWCAIFILSLLLLLLAMYIRNFLVVLSMLGNLSHRSIHSPSPFARTRFNVRKLSHPRIRSTYIFMGLLTPPLPFSLPSTHHTRFSVHLLLLEPSRGACFYSSYPEWNDAENFTYTLTYFE